ncbi:nucleotidyl transferase AbiEii/AbiGii toxin family protein [Filifactor villosus]|uniref:Nucleotidyl transferase AbiEii/AbiGii toxin family protein n=1 Tax=Filifactor villosus TaxID=29374 RepID=A0ABV9QIS2_9FIRM
MVPREIDYSYPILFSDEKLQIKAYPIFTILAEKIESVLVKNVSNTRAGDFYDVYILSKQTPDLDRVQLKEALYRKAEERRSLICLKEKDKYLNDIEKSKELQEIWQNYRRKNSYAKNLTWEKS